jgi:hypothetical protein
VLNFTLLHAGADAEHMVNRLLDPTQRGSLPLTELTHLTDLIARGIHNTYVLAGLLSVVALVLALMLPARLSPSRQ